MTLVSRSAVDLVRAQERLRATGLEIRRGPEPSLVVRVDERGQRSEGTVLLVSGEAESDEALRDFVALSVRYGR